tara:strand:+ start:584 stop:787 length:204 start_codon:yes stop_codon:yes gene_type:complete
MSASPPNIVFLHAHNTGRFIEPYGHAVPTPNLMKMAREGVLFHRYHVVAEYLGDMGLRVGTADRWEI